MLKIKSILKKILYSNLKLPQVFFSAFYFKGKGKLIIGDNNEMSNSIFAIEKGSILHFHDNVKLGQNCIFSISRNSQIIIGSNTEFEETILLSAGGKFEIGKNCHFGREIEISTKEEKCFGEFYLGSNSEIGDKSFIETSGGVIIGNDVSLGRNVTIYSHNHNYFENIMRWKTAVNLGQVTINDGTWVASNVIILPGVNIGKHAVVAAGSVVTKDVKESTVVAGNPAREIKNIND